MSSERAWGALMSHDRGNHPDGDPVSNHGLKQAAQDITKVLFTKQKSDEHERKTKAGSGQYFETEQPHPAMYHTGNPL